MHPFLLLRSAVFITLSLSALPSTDAHDVNVDALRDYIEQTRQTWEIPGLAVAIVKDDKVLLSAGFGVREDGKSELVDADTLFAIASNSKAFTAAALAILVDEGKVDWDDRVSDYLPWLKLKDLMTRDLRVRDLLCHRSGLGTFSGDLLWWGTSYSPREVLVRARELEPAAPFRAKYGYSNLMFLAAGLVIEEASGQPWAKFVDSRILKPLHMTRTVTSVRDLSSQGNFATPHKTLLAVVESSSKTLSKPLPWMNWDNMAAAGGIISSANEMSNWIRMQLRRGKLESDGAGAIFSTKQAQQMWAMQTPSSASESYLKQNHSNYRGYGLGWSLSDYHGHKVVSHGGGYDGMYSQVLLVPDQNVGVVVLTNSMTSISSPLTRHIMNQLLGVDSNDESSSKWSSFLRSRESFERRIHERITTKHKETSPSHPLGDYTGEFQCPLYGDASVGLLDGKLVLRLHANTDLVAELEHLHYDTFVIRWRKEFAWFAEGTAHFVADSHGNLTQIELDVPNDDMWFYELKLRRKSEPK